MSKINKILMLLHPEMDHLSYMLYNGLYKILGKDNVSVYPFVKHYQGQGQVDDWYILDDGKRGHTAAPGYVSSHQTRERSFDDLANNIRSFDVICLCGARTYAIRSLDQLITKCGRNNLPPIVFFEGEDYQSLDTIDRIKRTYNPIVCFKRELIQSELEKRQDLQPLYSLPFCAIIDNAPPDNLNKDIDVFALFGNTNILRENIVKAIGSSHLPKKYKLHVGIDRFINESEKSVWQDQTKFTMPTLMPYHVYLDLMSRAKINIVARGWGCDTLRRFEAPLYSGLILMENLPIITPDPFVDNVHAIYYNPNNLIDLVNRIDNYLSSDTERQRIGIAGRDHCLKYHTTEARARYFLNKVEQHI